MASNGGINIAIPNIVHPTEERPFTRFELVVTYKNETWTVLRRFSSFSEFHAVISKIVGRNSPLPPFPKKKLGKTDPAFLETRRLQLLSYMTNLVKIPGVVQSKALDTFLMMSNHQSTLIESSEPQSEIPTNNPSPYELFRKSSELNIQKSDTTNQVNREIVDEVTSSSAPRRTKFKHNSLMNDSTIVSERNESAYSPSAADQYSSRFPLHNTIKLGDPGVLEHILPSQLEFINTVDCYGQTPLQIAVLNAHVPLFFILARAKADVTVIDKKQNSLLHFAARSKSVKMIDAILDNVHMNINVKNNAGETPLHTLAKHVPKSFDCELLRLMLKRGANPCIVDNNGALPLHYCAATGKHTWCKLLLQQDEVDMNAVDNNGETAIHYATRYVQNRVVKLLIQEGADVMIEGENGTPLEVLYTRRAALGKDK